MKGVNYHSANYDFTFRHAINKNSDDDIQPNDIKFNRLNINNNDSQKFKHLWNVATSPKQNKTKTLYKATSNILLNTNNKNDNTNDIDINLENNNETNSNDEYSEDTAQNIVREFALTFPYFKPKLLEQFPKEWVEPKSNNIEYIDKTQELFQLSSLQRNEKEQLIHDMGLK